MTSLTFSLSDYKTGLAAGLYHPPSALCPYYEVDPVLYRHHSTTDHRRGNLRRAIDELRKRTEKTYFNETYPLQARTLDYSARAFPAYRFILPEVLSEDWLAIVDWGKFQRDHVLHQPLCGYVMLKLLDGHDVDNTMLFPDGKTLLDTCVDRILRWEGTSFIRDFLIGCGMRENDPIIDASNPIARNVWRIFFREVAYVAAVFHDLGYPWQYAERVQSNLDGMNAPAILQNRSSEQIVELFGHRLLFCALQGYQMPNTTCPSTWHEKITHLTDIAMAKTHGLPGALGFLHLNDCVRRYPSDQVSPLHLLCIEWAATAIMMHDMSNIYWGERRSSSDVPENAFLRLSFNKDPLSAIVTLVDVIQDFERPTATFGTSSSGRAQVTIEYPSDCIGTNFRLDGDVLTIDYQMKDNASRALKRSFVPKTIHDYFDAQYGYLDMRSLGIDAVQIRAV
ncbi:MAG: hypothetical protein ABFD66_12275 [Smithella sp.]